MRIRSAVAWAAMAMVVLGTAAHAQPVYKWVDADGKTHYGSQPPPAKQDAEPMKLQSNNGSTGSAGSKGGTAGKSAAATQYNADGTKKIPKEVQEFGEGLTKALGKVDGKQVPLNCAASVDNIQHQADLMLEVGQKNVRDGYMTQAAFDSTAPKIREAKGKYSVSDCQGASGNKKSFYQCMSSSKNHVTGCDKQFKH
ncbi:MAG: DUF4124 domain-containing protein [Gammaproteobacteria bacterium]|nr:DUF4124 domain-containing protein [Gammaproteobacteria bacterium]MBU0830138.1 DUF4124 domain-containing protein [Gammaproteobacteria bacterium]MBU0890647.1 DUF4124 domain-containing protein [Gammaproteobacteria bacterium]MBU1354378.1 DUF4124 domain-containing protein [Gammaproteobacteria bacterium]MBU1507058.1 DUF4124 domain-containing protein [Gammaproteobacteria bacterium]